jgi:hypothetical protein
MRGSKKKKKENKQIKMEGKRRERVWKEGRKEQEKKEKEKKEIGVNRQK